MNFGREDYNRRIIDTDDKIPQDEPVFFLRAKDAIAPDLLLRWAHKLRLQGGDPNMARNAEDHAQLMIDWQKENGCRTPDMYVSTERKRWKEELEKELKGSELNFDKVEDLFKKIYGNLDKLYIFIASELKQPLPDDLNLLEIKHLRIDDEDKYNQCKLALFMSKSFWKVIKMEL